jgi:hypothetical protein
MGWRHSSSLRRRYGSIRNFALVGENAQLRQAILHLLKRSPYSLSAIVHG